MTSNEQAIPGLSAMLENVLPILIAGTDEQDMSDREFLAHTRQRLEEHRFSRTSIFIVISYLQLIRRKSL